MKRLHVALYNFLRVLPFGLTAAALPALAAPAQAEIHKTPEEIACEEALRLNTIVAIEEFLRRYPDTNTACGALALDALQQFGPGGEYRSRENGGTGGGGYGS